MGPLKRATKFQTIEAIGQPQPEGLALLGLQGMIRGPEGWATRRATLPFHD